MELVTGVINDKVLHISCVREINNSCLSRRFEFLREKVKSSAFE